VTRPDTGLSRRAFLGAIGTGAVAGLAGCVGGDEGSTGDGRADWPHPYFSPEGTGYNPRATGPVSKPSESWGVEVSGIELARPVAFDETVYLATSERLRAFSVADGTELWSVESGPQSGFRSSVTVDSERVYVGHVGARTGVFAYTHDGEEAWHATTESSVWAPVVRPEPDRDHLYASDTAGNLSRVRASDGTVEWREEVFGPVRALAARYDTVVAGTEGGEVVTFQDEGVERGATGRWRTKLPGGVQALAVAGSDDVFAGFFGAGVARLRGGLRAGAVDWHREGPSPHGSLVVGPRRVFSTDGAGLDAFDRRAGSPAWQAGDDFFAPPAGAGDTVFASDTSDDGGVVAYDAGGGVGLDDTRVGAVRWRYDLSGRALTGPTPAHDALFVVESGGGDDPRRPATTRRVASRVRERFRRFDRTASGDCDPQRRPSIHRVTSEVANKAPSNRERARPVQSAATSRRVTAASHANVPSAEALTASGLATAATPTMPVMLRMLLPTTLPTETPRLRCRSATSETANSGVDVPAATIVPPMTHSETPAPRANSEAASTM